MSIAFSSKAGTLAALYGKLQSARLLGQLNVTWQEWSRDPAVVFARCREKGWSDIALIARSSASVEDGSHTSMAGRFTSVGNLMGHEQLKDGIGKAFASYGRHLGPDEIVFIQPYLSDLVMSGVAFACDPNTGGPYIVVNYQDEGDSAAVTGGRSKSARTLYHWRDHDKLPPAPLDGVIRLIRELQGLFGTDRIDVEFAVSRAEGLCLLQVRPLVVNAAVVDTKRHKSILGDVAQRIANGNKPHPYLSGEKTVYGIMPDWNPAEIIGVRPRPLALSLYRNLITDQVWAYQRSNYGYRNLRSFPLMVSFHGLPYIDVRVSFNSFVPADIERGLADRLVNSYVQRLLDVPSLHDKVEFEIVYSCYTLDLPQRLQALKAQGFSDADIATLRDSLRRLTNRVIDGEKGLWKEETAKIDILSQRRRIILDANLDSATRIYWLLEDCKRWGTLPFAGLARAGFIAMQILRSLVAKGILDETQYDQFMASTDTVSGQMIRDMESMARPVFLEKYGHLRPGTYDILSPRYDEAPDLYLGDQVAKATDTEKLGEFRLGLGQMKVLTDLLRSNGLDADVVGLFDFIRAAVQGREFSKFTFTRSLSDALSLFSRLGAEHGFSPEDLSYSDIRTLEDIVVSSRNPKDVIARSIEDGRAFHADTCGITLPPLIASESQVWSFEIPATEPNFVTQKTTEGHVCSADSPRELLKDGIIFIQNADPGYDWIFTHGIRALVTAYGGVNSHMAIRAGESGIPAVIGAGEKLFETWRRARRLRINCSNRRVDIL